MVQSFFASGLMLKEMNHTFITLIPKTPNPSTVHNFRPISLCNISYKIISKTLANRLKILLPKLITPWQAAAGPGRNIQDNSIIAHEIFHTLHQKRTGTSGMAALNLDLEKAFDKVEWPFLLSIFKHFGFSDKWIQMISQCISTPSFFILINGSPAGFFTSNRGIRQGDPISPFLFILVTDVLSRLFLQKEADSSLQGIKIARNCPPISHLMFVDDLVVFSRANHDDLATVQSCLTQFQTWSGLSINKRKSAITFSRNVSPSCKISLRNLIGLNQPTSKNFYLGLPTHIQRGHQAQFNTILEKINSRISGWKAKILSQAAKATLIKSVLKLNTILLDAIL